MALFSVLLYDVHTHVHCGLSTFLALLPIDIAAVTGGPTLQGVRVWDRQCNRLGENLGV